MPLICKMFRSRWCPEKKAESYTLHLALQCTFICMSKQPIFITGILSSSTGQDERFQKLHGEAIMLCGHL